MNQIFDFFRYRTRYKELVELDNAFNIFLNNDGKLSWKIDVNKLPEGIKDYEPAQKLKPNNLITTHVVRKLFEDGPKLMNLTSRQFEALEEMDLNIELKEYSQPYHTLAIPVPVDYGKNRIIDVSNIAFNPPRYIIITQELGIVLVTIAYSFDCVVGLTINNIPGLTMEESLTETAIDETRLGITNMETVLRMTKAALNGILIFDASHKRRVESGKRLRNGTQIPPTTYMEIDQTIALYDSEPIPTSSGRVNEEGGWTVKPHWRRGHWRMQRHGTCLEQVKRIRIKPVLIHKASFVGDLSTTTVNYQKG